MAAVSLRLTLEAVDNSFSPRESSHLQTSASFVLRLPLFKILLRIWDSVATHASLCQGLQDLRFTIGAAWRRAPLLMSLCWCFLTCSENA